MSAKSRFSSRFGDGENDSQSLVLSFVSLGLEGCSSGKLFVIGWVDHWCSGVLGSFFLEC